MHYGFFEMLHNEMDQDVHEHYIISFYEKTIVQGKFTILGLKIMHPHKSGFPVRFFKFLYNETGKELHELYHWFFQTNSHLGQMNHCVPKIDSSS